MTKNYIATDTKKLLQGVVINREQNYKRFLFIKQLHEIRVL